MPEIHKSRMSARERELRSRLAQLVTQVGMVRGSVSEREKVCGKKNCRCAQGQKHRALYLVASEDGQPRQLFIPTKLETETRECVETYHRIREILEELSQIHWNKLKAREI